MSTEAQLKALSNSELASGTQIPALKHRTVNNAIIEEMYDSQSRGDVLSGVQSALSLASGDQVLVIRSGAAFLLDATEFGFVDTLADLTDVSIPSPSNDQILAYNSGTSKWVAKDVNDLTSVVSITGAATTNQMVKFTGVNSIGDSIVSDNGTTVNIGGNLSVDSNLTVGTINSGTSSDFVKGDGSLDSTTYQDTSEKGQANGYAPLDSGAKVAEAYLPDSILGQVSYQGTWAASTNTPTLANPPASTTKGEYYVASDDGTQFGIDFKTGDWIISNGSAWEKVDNTDAVTSVFGRLGNVVANAADYASFYVDFSSNQSITGQKTFGSGDLRIVSGGSVNLPTIFSNSQVGSSQEVGFNTLGFNGNNNLFFTKGETGDFNGSIIAYDNTGIRTYTLPDASGTFAFTNLDNNFSVDQTINGNTTINGDLNIDGGKITIDTSAIVGREDILLSTVSDNTDDKFGIANGTATSSRFIPTFYGYTNGSYQSMIFRGLGDSSYDLTSSPPMINFSVANTDSSSDPNNGTLTSISQRDAFAFSTTTFDYIRVKANGYIGLGNNTNPTEMLDVNGNVKATSFLGSGSSLTGVAKPDIDNNFSVGQTIGGNTTINGNLTVDTDTLFVDAANNRVGIGTSSPTYKIDATTTSSGNGIKFARGADSFFEQFQSTSGGVQLAASGSGAFMAFRTGTTAGTTTERMRIDSSGVVKIIGGSNAFLDLDRQTSGNAARLRYATGGTDEFEAGLIGGVAGYHITDGSANPLMTIDSSGNVGIGTDSPLAKLHVESIGDTFTRISGNRGNANNLHIGNIEFENTFGSAGVIAEIRAITGDSGTQSTKGQLAFYTDDGTTYDERMRIDSSGNVSMTENLSVTGSINANSAAIENWSSDGRYARFGHKDLNNSTQYGYIQFEDSTIYLKSTTGIFLETNTQVSGNLSVTGSLSKGSGSFKIDHPLPEKKDTHHLVHSFVEAPQADNIYRGKIDLVDGRATINLDEAGRMTEGTFVLLNGNIQCFTSNESGWTAIRGKVEGNILTIEAQDAECTDTVSWLVIGERIDQHMIDTEWTDENGRVITEPLKQVEPTAEDETNN